MVRKIVSILFFVMSGTVFAAAAWVLMSDPQPTNPPKPVLTFTPETIHYGKDVMIRNNIFALGKKDQINRTRGEEHISLTFTNNIVYWKEGVLFSGDWKDKEYQYYTDNVGRTATYKTNFQSDWNIFYNPQLELEEVKFGSGSLADWQKRGYDKNSIYADPMFVDPEKFDFRLRPDSLALKRGFEPIDLDVEQ